MFLSIITTVTIVLGLCGALPQLAAMVRARSAAGQSSFGWTLGATVNVLLAYINVVGYQALPLAAGNLLSIGICVTAVSLIRRYGNGNGIVAEPAPAIPLHELPHGELVALRVLVDQEQRRRAERRTGELALALA